MKIFTEEEGSFKHKVNFVDENNVVLGYDLQQSCCEDADWFIAAKPQVQTEERVSGEYALEGWVFDTRYITHVKGDVLDAGEMAIFRITKGCEEMFIHIYNHHNGYYGHGFEFTVPEYAHLSKSGTL